MLEAVFYTRTVFESGEYKIDTSPLPDGMNFKIIAYSQVAGYTLTQWYLGDGSEGVAGETLWHQKRPILSGGGRLDLVRDRLAPDAKRRSSATYSDIWSEYAPSTIKVSDAIALALRENLIYFLER